MTDWDAPAAAVAAAETSTPIERWRAAPALGKPARKDRTMQTISNDAITQIRQGDVLLCRVAAPANPQRATDAGGQPLAGLRVEGERTGHAHVLPARVYSDGPRRLLMLERPEKLTHQEHAHIEVPAGWWEVRTQTEYVPAANRRVGRWD
jgi:hypothetical protein